MPKLFATVAGAILLLAGVGVAVAHYVLESGLTGKLFTLAVAAVLLVGGLALYTWGRGTSRRRGKDWSPGDGQK